MLPNPSPYRAACTRSRGYKLLRIYRDSNSLCKNIEL